jgi:hypothetical protein
MSQIKSLTIKSVLITGALIALTCVSSSCAKKASGLREAKKTNGVDMNGAVSGQAQQLAASQNALYKIASISTPVASTTGTGNTVAIELLTPSNQYLPVVTHHENGSLESQGVYHDTERGLDVFVNAKCSSDNCSKYLLLVSVTRNNQALFQTAAVSYVSDCSYYTISVTNSFSNVTALENLVQSSSAYSSPRNDCQN